MLPLSLHAPLPTGTPGELVHAYHERTKHHLSRYAAGPETLDWEAQPAPFRRFHTTPSLRLPLLSELGAQEPCVRAFAAPWAMPLASTPLAGAFDLARLGVLLQASLGITAWKAYGPDRWAVRANPSSGNLHPVEAYVVAVGLSFLEDCVYHYLPDQHALERRVSWLAAPEARGAAGLFIGLSTVMWREAWKYGERAFRYCQLDVGHALGALSVAAAALGLELQHERGLASEALALCLGLDQIARNARASELEEAEILLRIEPVGASRSERVCLAELLPQARRVEGEPSLIDARPMYAWPLVNQIAEVTRHAEGLPSPPRLRERPRVAPEHGPATRSLSAVVLGRRSAQRFDIQHVMKQAELCGLLASVMPGASPPWTSLVPEPHIDLVVFVLRVEGLASGVYLLERRGERSRGLRHQLSLSQAAPVALDGACTLPFTLVRAVPERELMRLARALHCHQDIASNGCFALGMLAELAPSIAARPEAYRELHREAGLIGQVLYLGAEAIGLRGTGIGCYFDDAVHQALGLQGTRYQSLYHFTLGKALDDPRIQLTAAYPERSTP